MLTNWYSAGNNLYKTNRNMPTLSLIFTTFLQDQQWQTCQGRCNVVQSQGHWRLRRLWRILSSWLNEQMMHKVQKSSTFHLIFWQPAGEWTLHTTIICTLLTYHTIHSNRYTQIFELRKSINFYMYYICAVISV